MSFRMRPAADGDTATLEGINALTRAHEFAASGLSVDQQQRLLGMQATTQLNDYRTRFPGARYELIEVDGCVVGRVIVARSADELLLVDIAIVPSAQAAGIGTDVIRRLQAEAEAAGIALILSVLVTNVRAQSLYRRLGFRAVSRDDVYLEMTWRAGAETA